MPEVKDVLAGRYELQEVIASGGMATVWRARDQVLTRTVAVKILHDHLAEDQPFLERFRREAIAAAGLNHPHVVSIYDTGEMESPDSLCHYIVMEHCGRGTLGTLLRDDGPFPSSRVAGVGATVCDALDYAHSKGIVHRDVKPANVLIGDDGLLKVGDFGIAKAIAEKHDITTTGKIMGTVAYISPEYATDQELDSRSDVYSLGVVLYELAVGKPPFLEETSVATAMRHVNDPVPPLRSRRAGISRALETVILKALEKDPDDRFGSAGEMREALEQVGSNRESAVTQRVPVRAAPHDGSSFRTESRWVMPVLGLIIGAILLAAIAAALFDNGDDTPEGRGGRADAGTGEVIDAGTPTDFDPPPGDGTEDQEGLIEVVDGDVATTWKTDVYQDALRTFKSGVGILFDMGSPTQVGLIEVTTPDPDLDLEILAGDERPTSADQLDVLATERGASARVSIDADATARYWVIWITDLPGGGGGLAQLAEVKFFAP
jgi:serine/threonine protein kinase